MLRQTVIKWTSALAFAACITLASVSANALNVSGIVSEPVNPDTTRTDNFAQAGFGFFAPVSGDKVVDQLGFWVSPNSGSLAVDHQVSLYNFNNANYTKIATATVKAGSTPDHNGFAWASIAPTLLSDIRQNADYYIVTASVGVDEWAPFTGSANAPTNDGSIGTRTNNGWFSAAAAPAVGGTASLNPAIGNGGYFGPNVGVSDNTYYIADAFSGITDGAQINGRTPDVANIPGGTWVNATSQVGIRGTLTAGFGNPLPGAFGQHQNASAISIAGAPDIITISVDMKLNPLNNPTAGSASAGRGLALGFYDSPGAWQFSQNHFTGLVLDAQGNLNLVHDPNNTGFFGAGSVLGDAIAYGGVFDPTAFHTLSYQIDRASGRILDISLSGSTADYSAFYNTNLFNLQNTAFAGLYSSSAVANTFGAFDNFNVFESAIPEPATAALGLMGVMGMMLRRRRNT